MQHILAFILALLLAGQVAASEDIKAVTSDGKSVILKSDGTWEYAKSDDSKAQEAERAKPEESTKVLKSKLGFCEIWFDPEKWKTGKVQNKAAEFELNHSSGEAYAMIIAERLGMTPEALKRLALKNAKETAADVTIQSEQEVTVNGVKVLAVKFNGTIEGIPLTYYAYYWSGDAGSVQVVTFTGKNLFKDYGEDLTELLNGLVITKP